MTRGDLVERLEALSDDEVALVAPYLEADLEALADQRRALGGSPSGEGPAPPTRVSSTMTRAWRAFSTARARKA